MACGRAGLLTLALAAPAAAQEPPSGGDAPVDVRPAWQRSPGVRRDPVQRVWSGRCVAAETGQPLAGCEVFVVGAPMSQVSVERYPYWFTSDRVSRPQDSPLAFLLDDVREFLFNPVVPELEDIGLDRHFLSAAALAEARAVGHYQLTKCNATTDEDGRFRVRFAPRCGERGWELEIASPGRMPRRGSRGLEFGELGDLALTIGVRVQGRIVDTDGVPVEDARLRLLGLQNVIPSGSEPCVAETRRDGVFAFAEPIPQGTYELVLRGAGARIAGPRVITVGEHALKLEVRAERRPVITGVVENDAGGPVESARLIAVADGELVGRAMTDGAGRFRLRCASEASTESPPVLALARLSPLSWLPPSHELIRREPIPWGTDDARLVARARRDVRLRVVDASTSKRVLDSLSVDLEPLGAVVHEERRWHESLSAGATGRLKRVPSGPHRLRLRLSGSGRLVPVILDVDLPLAEPRRLHVRLHPAAVFRVLVRTSDGRPIWGAEVQTARHDRASADFPPREDDDHLSNATSDRDGFAFVFGARSGVAVDLRVRAEGFRTAMVEAVDDHADPVRVTLQSQ
ncbi:MAG: carboxypeptidase-like regulatory domain-containing protein [Planctomycetota bacterium]